MNTLFYYDPDSCRRDTMLAALRPCFDIRCVGSILELRRASLLEAHDLLIDGSAPPKGLAAQEKTAKLVYLVNADEAYCYDAVEKTIKDSEYPVLYFEEGSYLRLRTRIQECINFFADSDADTDADSDNDITIFHGRSAPIRNVEREIRRYANSREPVLICGETGSGKDVAAKALHMLSYRSKGPFLAFNCATLSHELADSTLFGSTKGAFTDALNADGLFKQADQGTLFLDEIGCLAKSVQPKLLRAIEGGGFRCVGGAKTEMSDTRIVAATAENLQYFVNKKMFRLDLFFRFSVLEIWIPPLRNHIEDIPFLALHFCAQHAANEASYKAARESPSESVNKTSHSIAQKNVPLISSDISPAALDKLQTYDWPGNIRELRSVIIRAAIRTQALRRSVIEPDAIIFNCKNGR